jgi:Kef-type K+ transport system membrane component KefB
MSRYWTLRRASAVGAIAGLAALVLWPFLGLYGPLLLRLFFALAALSGISGFSVLVITLRDMARNSRRGSRMRALRGFDTALGITLLVLSWFELRDAIGLFPA